MGLRGQGGQMTDDHETRDGNDEPQRGADDAPLVARVHAGDPDAFGKLYDRWFDRVLDLAYRIVWDHDVAADVAQDAFLSAYRNIGRLEDPHAFGGWLLRIARNAALDRQRADRRTRPFDDEQLAMIERNQMRPEDTLGTVDDPVRAAEDASYVGLLWDAADALGERDREVLDLSLRHGLAPAEIGEVVGVNRNAANQLVHRVRNRLATAVAARMLWRGGEPSCAELRAELVAHDVDRFDGDAVRVATRHAATCEACTARKQLRLDPQKMFAAIPIMVLPSLKAQVAHALDGAGVPMQGSTAFDPSNARGRHGRARRWLLGTAAAAAVVLFVVLIAAGALSREPAAVVSIAATPSSTTSISTSSTSTTNSSTSTTTIPTTTTTIATPVVPPVTTPPTIPAPATTTTTLPIASRFAMNPANEMQGYSMSAPPELSWTVTNVARVHVSGANVDAKTTAGSVQVCPDQVDANNNCSAAAGTYSYTLDAFNAHGTRVVHKTVTLTITTIP